MSSYENPEWSKFRDWKKKKDLLHFMMKWGGHLGSTAWYGLRTANKLSPQYRAMQKY